MTSAMRDGGLSDGGGLSSRGGRDSVAGGEREGWEAYYILYLVDSTRLCFPASERGRSKAVGDGAAGLGRLIVSIRAVKK